MNFKTMLQFLGIGLLIYLLSRLFTKSGEPKFKVSTRSDCSKEFADFAKSLDLKANKKRALAESKGVIQKKILDYFRGIEWGENGNVWKGNPQFFVQGSFQHGTCIRTQNDICDIDLGVYFKGKPPISPATLQKHIYNALLAHTSFPVVVKSKCVRIKYANFFHIDLPIYYYDENTGKYFFGTSDQWVESDPKEFTAWVAARVNPHDQMLRVVRYFKAWADNIGTRKSHKMPSGVALTVWVQEFYVRDARDDLSFIKTAHQIFKHLSEITFFDDWKCVMPVIPFDNLIERLTDNQCENFLASLGEMIKKSEDIFGSENRERATKRWSKLFGKWFPLYVDEICSVG
jgi:hypothetical protein